MNITTVTAITITVSFLDDFFTFLRNHDALVAWVKAFEELSASPEKTLNLMKEEKDPTTWIKGGFIWARTEEGHRYWEELNDEWEDYLKEVAKKAAPEDTKIFWKGTN